MVMAAFSLVTMEYGRQRNDIFKRDKRDKNLSKKNLYPVKMPYKIESADKGIFR